MEIKKLDLKEHKYKVGVFGLSGSGKTSLVKTIPLKTIIFSAEAGLLPLKHQEIDIVESTPITQSKLLSEFYNFLVTDKTYDCVVIDSLTEIIANKHAELEATVKDKFAVYNQLLNWCKTFIKAYRDLDKHIVFLMLAKSTTGDDGKRTIDPLIAGSFSSVLPSFLDEYYYLFKDKDGNRMFLTTEKEGIIAKSRHGFDPIIPASLDFIKPKEPMKEDKKK